MSIGKCAPGETFAGYGAVWQYCHPITGNFITVAGLNDTTKVTRTQEEVETTSQDGDGWSTFIPNTIKSLDEVTIEADFHKTEWDQLVDMMEDGTITRWRHVLTQVADNPYVEFCAFIKTLEASFPLKEIATKTVTLRPSGKPERGNV